VQWNEFQYLQVENEDERMRKGRRKMSLVVNNLPIFGSLSAVGNSCLKKDRKNGTKEL
jgi:hypothetical protein